jgi:CHAT domain-containing protein
LNNDYRMKIKTHVSAQVNQAKLEAKGGTNVIAVGSVDSASYRPFNNKNDSPHRSWRDIGYDLCRIVFDPLISAIGEDCRKLFIAPEGELTRLPFETLPLSKDAIIKLVIDDYAITYLTTGRDLLRINKESDRLPNEPIVVADPDFDLNAKSSTGISFMNNTSFAYSNNLGSAEEIIIGMRTSGTPIQGFDRGTIHFKRLEGTKDEGEEISKLLGVQPWMGEGVLESKLKSSRSPQIMHIATHGFFLENQHPDAKKEENSSFTKVISDQSNVIGVDNTNIVNRLSNEVLENPMLRSGLALAGANSWIQNKPLPEDAEDGILTAEDVSVMDLSDTELVVLSACETGLGQIHVGEGVFGLRRSFILAGTQTLVMSLWKVPDEHTKELMIDFYKRLKEGKGRADALREAQLAMKQNYKNPYYWGAFICQGNPGPIVEMLASQSKQRTQQVP